MRAGSETVSNADEAVVAQLLQFDAPRDLKIEFEMSIVRAAGGFVHPGRRRPATQTCEVVAPPACARIMFQQNHRQVFGRQRQ